MGCCATSQPAPIVVMILGTSCVGKTTFFKQLKILHLNGFNDEETGHYKKIMFSNICSGIAELIFVAEQKKINLGKYELEVKLFRDGATEEGQLDLEHVQAAKTLWNAKEFVTIRQDAEVKTMLNEGNLEYFMENIDQISKPDYYAQNEDIVRCRQRTVGFTQLEFQYENDIIRVVDLGGHSSEQKKWDTITENAHSILYLASLTHYNMPDPYHPKRTKLEESLQVFDELIKKEAFKNCGLIIFLNKEDLFKNQIKQKKFSEIFPDFDGDDRDPEDCANFIKDLYLSLLPDGRECFTHFTCVVDTKIMENIISDVMSWILKRNLQDMGLYYNGTM